MIVREIGIIFVVAGILGILMRILKQPTIVAYVLAGVLVGPLAFGCVTHEQTISELSELAVVVMLFVIGIEMDLTRLKKVGLVAMLGGSIQVGLTFLLGFGVSKVFGTTNITASYLGFALSFSSTMLVVKVLGEKYDLNTLYGRIALGILIMQDIFAIFALSILGSADEGFSISTLLTTSTLAAGLILVVVFVCGKFVFPRIFSYVARDREILFLVTMATLFIVAFYAENQKLSMGIGSFLAGLSIAELSYKHEVIGDLKALKSFFTILFFAVLGLQLAPSVEVGVQGQESISVASHFLSRVWDNLWLILSFSFAAIVIKPILITVVVKCFGYHKSAAINTGLSLGQFSEFSLLLLTQGVVLKHVSADLLSPIIIVTIVSMVMSSYLMEANLTINRLLDKWTGCLDMIAFAKPKFDFPPETKDGFDVLLVGVDKLGHVIEHALRKLRIKYVVVDSNPDMISRVQKTGTPFIFGDINNHEVLAQLNFGSIRTVFSTVPDIRDNELLINYIGKVNPEVNFIGIVDSRSKAEELYRLGAHYVLVTYMLAGTQLINNRAVEESGINLKTMLENLGDVRKRGARHRERLFDEIFGLHEEEKESIANVAET